jgi:hypothetical protein
MAVVVVVVVVVVVILQMQSKYSVPHPLVALPKKFRVPGPAW